MDIGEIFAIAFVVVMVIAVISLGVFLGISTIRYGELRTVIDDCNKDFGEGNWTFKEYKNKYTCTHQNQQKIVTTTKSKDCYLNDIKIDCEMWDGLK